MNVNAAREYTVKWQMNKVVILEYELNMKRLKECHNIKKDSK